MVEMVIPTSGKTMEFGDGEKLWFLCAGLGDVLDLVFCSIGPYEPDSEFPTEDELVQRFRSAGFAKSMVPMYYSVMAETEGEARSIAAEMHNDMLQRRRDEAAQRFNESNARP